MSLISTHPGHDGGRQKGRLMWTRIVLKPWWARTFASAGVYAVFVAAGWCARWLAGDPYQDVLLTFAVHIASIPIFGLLVAACTSDSHKAYTNALDRLDSRHRSTAIDASFRGPVPVDVPVRDAALRVGQRRLSSARFWRVMWLALLCLGVFEDVFLKGTSDWDPLDWINFPVVLGFTVTAWYVSLSVKHRLQTLTQPGDVDVKSMGEVR
jgi:hypothetical protein